MRLLALLLFMANTAALLAQPGADSLSLKNDGVEIETLVKLRSGDNVRGTMTGWQRGDTLVLKTFDGEMLRFAPGEVLRVEQFRYRPGAPFFHQKQGVGPAPVEIETIVDLRNGGRVRGALVEWERGSHLVLATRDGLRLRFSEGEVRRVNMKRYGGSMALDDLRQRGGHAPREHAYAFRERGWYNATCLGLMMRSKSGGAAENYNFTTAVGFQMNLWGGIGIGAGLDQYGSQLELATVPVFVEYRGYLLKKTSTPYFNLMVGHGFARKLTGYSDPFGDGSTKLELNGGRFISPNIGYRVGANRFGNLTIDIGARLQSGGFSITNPSPFAFNQTADKLYRRYTLRMGLVF